MDRDVLIRLYHVPHTQGHRLIHVKNSLVMEYCVGGQEAAIVLIEHAFKKHQPQEIQNVHNSLQDVSTMEQDVRLQP